MKQSSRLMWDHDGLCSCGKRTYLFSQCFKCLQEEALDDERRRAEEELDEEIYTPAKDEVTPEALASGQTVSGQTAAEPGGPSKSGAISAKTNA